MNICWECIVGRHRQCNGFDDAPPVGAGTDVPCECDIPHGMGLDEEDDDY